MDLLVRTGRYPHPKSGQGGGTHLKLGPPEIKFSHDIAVLTSFNILKHDLLLKPPHPIAGLFFEVQFKSVEKGLRGQN